MSADYYPWNMPQADDCAECGCRFHGHHGPSIGCEGAGGNCRCPGYSPRGRAANDERLRRANIYDGNQHLIHAAED